MKNIGKIILLVLGVVLIALGIKAFVTFPDRMLRWRPLSIWMNLLSYLKMKGKW